MNANLHLKSVGNYSMDFFFLIQKLFPNLDAHES